MTVPSVLFLDMLLWSEHDRNLQILSNQSSFA
jgi:hypothetical protein